MAIVDRHNSNQAITDLQKKLGVDPKAFAVVVAGPSGVGKTTICRRILVQNPDIKRCVTTTTRKPRQEETEGVERHFVSAKAFQDMLAKGQFVEHAEVHGHLYGATLDAVYAAMKGGHVMLMDVDVQGVVAWKETLKDRCVTVFVLPPSLETLEKRLADRESETESHFELRMNNAIEELRQAQICDYIIVNDDLEDAVLHLQSIIDGERHKSVRMQDPLEKLGIASDI